MFEKILELIKQYNRIIIHRHKNPDGDALGSMLGMAHYLTALGKEAIVIAPDAYPDFLAWMPGSQEIVRFDKHRDKAELLIAMADVVFAMDYNALSRVDDMGPLIEKSKATKVLVDHHLQPEKFCHLTFSYPQLSSTCEVVFRLIAAMEGYDVLTKAACECIYAGMMTDTGNFSFSFLTPELFRAVADLSETGINIPQIYNNVYNSFTESRARLFGYVINRKMKIFHNGTVAHMSLEADEMKRFWFQQGDSEGFGNYPLTIKKMKMSAMFTQHSDCIRVSLRSRGNIDVNIFAQRYFNGGGHKNAAGGKSMLSMEETLRLFEKYVKEYADEGML